jgi:hypothetical protein
MPRDERIENRATSPDHLLSPRFAPENVRARIARAFDPQCQGPKRMGREASRRSASSARGWTDHSKGPSCECLCNNGQQPTICPDTAEPCGDQPGQCCPQGFICSNFNGCCERVCSIARLRWVSRYALRVPMSSAAPTVVAGLTQAASVRIRILVAFEDKDSRG